MHLNPKQSKWFSGNLVKYLPIAWQKVNWLLSSSLALPLLVSTTYSCVKAIKRPAPFNLVQLLKLLGWHKILSLWNFRSQDRKRPHHLVAKAALISNTFHRKRVRTRKSTSPKIGWKRGRTDWSTWLRWSTPSNSELKITLVLSTGHCKSKLVRLGTVLN